jgi:hypothetical protein
MASATGGAAGVILMGIDPEFARAGNYFDPLNLSPNGLFNFTSKPMLPPYPAWEPGEYPGELLEPDYQDLSGQDLPAGQDLEEQIDLSPLSATTSIFEEDLLSDTNPVDQAPSEPSDTAEGETAAFSAEPSDTVEILEEDQTDQADLGEDFEETPVLPDYYALPPEDLPPIILGEELSYIVGRRVLDELNIIAPFGRVTPIGKRVPTSRFFQVAGTFQTNIYDFDSRIAYTTIPAAQEILGMDDSVSFLEVMVDDIYQAPEVRTNIINLLGPGTYWGNHWIEMNLSLFSALKLERTAMFIILTLIILVAAFNIASTLIMMVTEKTRDIAILKAMGASSGLIRRIFTIQGLIVGGIGTLGGLFFGVLICVLLQRYEFISLPPEVYLMNTLPVEIRPFQIILITLISLLISYLATLYPSREAAKLDPVEAIRYE